jgi:uncharacterized Ntn-hydrolase superfamily protein
MIDLTNKTVDEINTYITKYAKALEIFRPEAQPYMAYMINITVDYLNEKYKDLTANWKTWVVVLVKRHFDTIKTEEDIKKIIDKFFVYYNDEYQKYCENFICATEWDRDNGFLHQYLNKKSR